MKKMKKFFIIGGIVAVVIIAQIIWLNNPIDILNEDYKGIKEIVIKNGNTGEITHIDDLSEVKYIIDNLNEIELEREGLSIWYSGYSFDTTIYLENGNEYGGFNNFIINSDDTIRKDPFFYKVTKGKIDYDYIQKIVNEKENNK